jgi:hypothetical protein
MGEARRVREERSINTQTIIILAVLFAFYVAGDVMTTIWLIERHPKGIAGELNPLGAVLYTGYGLFGIIISKVLVFIVVSVAAMIMEYNYPHDRIVISATRFSILGLMAWSLIAVTVNVLMVYVLSLEQGTGESAFLLRLYVILFSITLAGLIVAPMLVRSSLGIVEIILGGVVILGPLLFSPGLYQHLLAQNVMNMIIYLVSMIGIAAMMILSIERLYKYAFPAR